MTPLERITARLAAQDAATTRAIGDACAANPQAACTGPECPLWQDDEGVRRRAFFRECDAYRDLTGLAPTAVPIPPRRGVCGALL